MSLMRRWPLKLDELDCKSASNNGVLLIQSFHTSSDTTSAICLAVLGAGGADVSPVDMLSHSHAPNITFSLPDDRDFDIRCDSGWRRCYFVLPIYTIEFFLILSFHTSLISLLDSFTE
ncbi:hypothetical protein Tco_0489904 [Tanacetum coccineum]